MGFYEQLRERVETSGCEVMDHALLFPSDPRGAFDREWKLIKIFHANRSDAIDDLPDACVLAHEFGHFRSLQAGQQSARYHEIIDRPDPGREDGEMGAELSEEDKALVIAEEERAWDYGREELAALGFDHWEVFEQERRRGLEEYGRRLSKSQLRVGE